MLSIVYAIVLWASLVLMMSSTKAAMNSFDECNIFEKASQISVIVCDNKLNNSNDEAKAAMNSFDECNIFEKASQISVIVCDNKLNKQ